MSWRTPYKHTPQHSYDDEKKVHSIIRWINQFLASIKITAILQHQNKNSCSIIFSKPTSKQMKYNYIAWKGHKQIYTNKGFRRRNSVQKIFLYTAERIVESAITTRHKWWMCTNNLKRWCKDTETRWFNANLEPNCRNESEHKL